MVKMDKEHTKQFKKSRKNLKKKSDCLEKAEKTLKKSKNNQELVHMRNNIACELHQRRRSLYEKEMIFVREIGCQERSIYAAVAAGLSKVIGQEFAIFKEGEKMEELMEKMKKIISQPPTDTNSRENPNLVNTGKHSFVFVTPPSTPGGSRMGSRTSSINSVSRNYSSAGSVIDYSNISRNNSVSSQKVRFIVSK